LSLDADGADDAVPAALFITNDFAPLGAQMNRLGLDGQTMFGMPPVEHITLAADLDCGHISIGLGPVPWKLDRFPDWSLRDNTGLRREMVAAMRDRGVVFAQGEGCIVRAGLDVRNYAGDLDLFAELGAVQISTVTMEPDASRAQAQLALLAELADQRGMELTLEFAPPHSINTFEKALSAIRSIAKPNVRLTIDAMHFFRSGGSVDQLALAGGSCIGHVQLCDVPLSATTDDYYQEACFGRRLPGEGDLPLRALLAALPKDVRVGLEIPMLARISAEASLEALVARAVALARELLAADTHSRLAASSNDVEPAP
jgi:sugar phosphate isomerase/epimerase